MQQDERLDDFFLVRGTALALHLGHRLSIDLDLFTREEFDQAALSYFLEAEYRFQTVDIDKNTVLGFVDGVKTDFITHAYPLVHPLISTDGVRMAGTLDIAAMKLNAIGRSGQRQKEFFDIYYLLQLHSLGEMLAAYEVKYPQSSTMIAVRALTYFSDIDFDIEPLALVKPVLFDSVKKRLQQATENSDQVFLRE